MDNNSDNKINKKKRRNKKVKNEIVVAKDKDIIVVDNNEIIPVDKNDITISNNELFKKKTRKGFHFSFGMRLALNIIIIILLVCGLVYTFNKSFSITKGKSTTYKERSNIDYKVYLKTNTFYDDPYLDKGMAYVASIIDKIDVRFNYQFTTNTPSNLDITYKIVAKLVIASQNNSSVFYEKEYELTKDVIDEMVDKTDYLIDRNVVIDYNYYNDLANEFKSSYAVNTNSRLDVYLVVEEKNKKDNSYELTNSSTTTLSIPLSQQEISINLNDSNIDNENSITENSKFVVSNVVFLIISIVIVLLLFITITSLLKKILLITRKKKSEYDKFVNRILVGYDRIIINIKTAPNMDEYNIIKVDSFQELVDVRDNTKEPINYYVINEHQKCEFFVINNKNLYLYVVKAVDIEGEQK